MSSLFTPSTGWISTILQKSVQLSIFGIELFPLFGILMT
jgi:hypothetical protein